MTKEIRKGSDCKYAFGSKDLPRKRKKKHTTRTHTLIPQAIGHEDDINHTHVDHSINEGGSMDSKFFFVFLLSLVIATFVVVQEANQEYNEVMHTVFF